MRWALLQLVLPVTAVIFVVNLWYVPYYYSQTPYTISVDFITDVCSVSSDSGRRRPIYNSYVLLQRTFAHYFVSSRWGLELQRNERNSLNSVMCRLNPIYTITATYIFHISSHLVSLPVLGFLLFLLGQLRVSSRTLSIALFLFETHSVSETGLFLRFQMEYIQLGPFDRGSPDLRTPAPATACFIYPILCWYRCSDIETSSTDCAQLYRCHLRTETETGLRNIVWFK
jgi:hypothetical protein